MIPDEPMEAHRIPKVIKSKILVNSLFRETSRSHRKFSLLNMIPPELIRVAEQHSKLLSRYALADPDGEVDALKKLSSICSANLATVEAKAYRVSRA